MSNTIEISEQPRIVKSHDIHIDTDYAEWIAELKHRYRSAQVKASARVNAEKLLFNWELGCDLVQKKAEERWGAGVVEQVSLDLQRESPKAEGLSTPNLWAIKRWYLFYNQYDIIAQCTSFKIGKTAETLLDRLSQPDYNDVYTHIISVFIGTKEDVDDMESYLISRFINHPKCDYKKDGDASNNDTMAEDADKYHAYVVWK